MFGEGRSRRDYTFIDDIISGILACRSYSYDYEVYNLGRSDTVELATLIEKIERVLGKKANVTIKPNQPGDVRQTFADISKARAQLGFEPKTSIDDGLRKFADWYLHKQESVR